MPVPVENWPETDRTIAYTLKVTNELNQVPGKITQVFAADEGRRVNEWVLSPDGKTLVLNVTVSSPTLTRPVVYALTYKRSP